MNVRLRVSEPGQTALTVSLTARMTLPRAPFELVGRAGRGAASAVRRTAVTLTVLVAGGAGDVAGAWALERGVAPEGLFCLGVAVFVDGVRYLAGARQGFR